MKKLLWILGGFFVVFLVAAIAVPLFVRVDDYRPQIQAEVNKRINGKLELGKLSLSLWGKVKVHAESIRLSVNGFPQPLLDTQGFYAELPIWPLLSGHAQIVAVLDSPKIEVMKELDGRMNVLELMKTPGAEGCATGASAPGSASGTVQTTAAAPRPERNLPKDVKRPPKAAKAAPAVAPAPAPEAPAAPVTPAPPATVGAVLNPCPPATTGAPGSPPVNEPVKIPSLISGATLGVRVEKGEVHYSDKAAKSDYRVSGLDIDAKNLGLGSKMSLKVKAPLKGQMPSLKFDGPVEATAELSPVLVGTSVRAAKGEFYIDASPLKLDMPGKFVKPAGMPLVVKGKLDGNEKETLIEIIEVKFHDFRFFAKGHVALRPLNVRLDLSADPIKIEKAREFAPMLAEYDVKGTATFNARAEMDPANLKISGGVRVSDGSVFPKAYLRAPLNFQAQAGFNENSATITRASFTGPETDLQLTGSVKNFLAPVFAVNLTGTSFNADKVLVLPAAGASAKGEKGAPPAPAPAPPGGEAPGATVSPVVELAKNPIVAAAQGEMKAEVAKVIVYGSALEKVEARATLKDLNLRLQEASLRTYSGTVRTEGNFNLRSPNLPFTSQGAVSGISGGDAFRTYFPKYQNTLSGTVNAQWNVNGALYPAAARIRSMGGSAKLAATDGVIKSIDVQKTINGVMQKVPFLKGRPPLEIDDGFKSLTAEVRFDGGVIKVEPVDVQPRNKGFVLKGKSTINENLEQETFLDVYDPQGRLPRDIQRPGKPALALRVTGPLTAPSPDYEYTVKKLAVNGAKNAVVNQVGKVIDKFIGNQEGEKNTLKDAAQKLKEKLKLKL